MLIINAWVFFITSGDSPAVDVANLEFSSVVLVIKHLYRYSGDIPSAPRNSVDRRVASFPPDMLNVALGLVGLCGIIPEEASWLGPSLWIAISCAKVPVGRQRHRMYPLPGIFSSGR